LALFALSGAFGVPRATAQTVIFSEPFTDNSQFSTQLPSSFAALSNGNAYWGIWDETGSTDDFGSSPTPGGNKVPNYSNYNGNILVGRKMDHDQVLAAPGIITWENIDVSGYETGLTLSLLCAARSGQSHESGDYIRLFVRENGAADWGTAIFERTGAGLDALSETFSTFPTAFNKPGSGLDIKLEMFVDEGTERIAVEDLILTGTISSVSGCTDVNACNHDPQATTDDGSCVLPDVNGNCCTLQGSAASFLGGGESDTLWFQVDSGSAESIALDLEWVLYGAVTGEQPADLLIQIHAPNGGCAWFGGESGSSVAGCDGLGEGATVYPTDVGNDWSATEQTQTVTDTVDVSGVDLSGAGLWSIVLINGRTGAGAVSYNLDVGLDYVCGVQLIEGCTDAGACNYDAAAGVDDGSCFFAEGAGGCDCEVLGSGVDTLDHQSPVGTPVTFQATSVDGPELFTMMLDYTNVTANDLAWPSDILIRILDPGGNCSWFGGYDFTAEDVPDCDAADELVLPWPPIGWTTTQSGQYTAALDLSASDLTGNGTWSVTMLNGWDGINEANGSQTDNGAIYDLSWSLTGLCGIGCTDGTACNYDANVVVDDGSCAYADLSIYQPFDQLFELTIDTSGVVFLDEAALWSQLGVDNGCGLFTYEFVEDGCEVTGQEMPSYSSVGIYSLTVKVSDENTTIAVGVNVDVDSESYPGCSDFAACNFNLPEYGEACIYPGEVGWCDNPDAGSGYRLAQAMDGSICICVASGFDELYFEDFGPGGASGGNGSGYGYLGYDYGDFGSAIGDVNTAANDPEWVLSSDDPNYSVGGLQGTEADYWSTVFLVDGNDVVTDTVFDGNYLFDEYRWASREIAVAEFSWLRVELEMTEDGTQEADDYIRARLIADDVAEDVLVSIEDDMVQQFPNWESFDNTVPTASSLVELQVEARNDASDEYHSFDDVKVSGWGRQGCTDSRATQVSYDATAHVEDGSCVFDQDTVFAQYTGWHTARIWSDTAVTAKQRLGGFAQALDMTTSVVVSEGCQITANPSGADMGVVHVNDLRIEDNGAFYLPAGTELHVHGTYRPIGEKGVFGPGELHVHGGWDWSGQTESDRLALGDVVLEDGASLEVPEGKVLAISGNLVFPAGSIGVVTGTVVMDGSEEQAISGGLARFDGIRIDKCTTSTDADVVFETDGEIQGRLELIGSSTMDMGAHILTFTSGPSAVEGDEEKTGLLDMIPSTATLSFSGGQTRVQRYLAEDGADDFTLTGYTLLGSPIQNVEVGDLDGIDGFNLQGWPGTVNEDYISSILIWDETNSTLIQPTSNSTQLDTLGGIWALVAYSQSPTLVTSGTLNSHVEGDSKTFSLTRTDNANTVDAYEGWNLVYNPYQARLDWNQVIGDAGNATLIEDQYVVYDTQIRETVRYSALNANGGVVDAAQCIEPGQAFYVRKTDIGAGTLTLTPSMIDNEGPGADFIRSENEHPGTVILETENQFGATRTVLRFGEQGIADAYVDGDLSRLASASVRSGELAFVAGVQHCVAKSLPPEVQGDLFVRSRANFPTTVRVLEAPDGFCGQIVDQQTGEGLALVAGEEMVFTLPAHEADSGRFVLEVHDWARTEGVMPSCPGAVDGLVEVEVGESLSANIALLDEQGQLMDQAFNVQDVVEFVVPPGQYGVVVTATDGVCPKVQREVIVPPGEQPELLGLEWAVPECNAGLVDIAFELYGGGVFGWTLFDDQGDAVSQGAGNGEVGVTGLVPGEYNLEVGHACLAETRAISALDAGAPELDAEWEPVVVLGEDGQAVWQATCTTPDFESCRWLLPDGNWVETISLELVVDQPGQHEVLLEVQANGCTAEGVIQFTAVSSLRKEDPGTWSVSQDAVGWSFVNPGSESTVDWVVLDMSGRLIDRGRGTTAGFLHVAFPRVGGVYWVVLQEGAAMTSMRVFAP